MTLARREPARRRSALVSDRVRASFERNEPLPAGAPTNAACSLLAQRQYGYGRHAHATAHNTHCRRTQPRAGDTLHPQHPTPPTNTPLLAAIDATSVLVVPTVWLETQLGAPPLAIPIFLLPGLSNPFGGTLVVGVLSEPSVGSVAVSGSGNDTVLTFTPPAGTAFIGEVSFTYNATNGVAPQSAVGTVVINIGEQRAAQTPPQACVAAAAASGCAYVRRTTRS